MAKTTRKYRRKFFALALVIALLAGALFAADRILLSDERLRRLAESVVAEYTGIQMHIGTLHATWFPAQVTATDITLAVPDASANVDRVVVDVHLSRLLSRKIAISSGAISGLVLHLPDTARAISDIIDQVEQTVDSKTGGGDGSPPIVSVDIDNIVAAAHIYLGEDLASVVVADVRLDNLLSSRVGIHTDAALRNWGDAARLYGDVELLRAEPHSPWQADGEAWLDALETEKLPLKNSPEGVFAAAVTFTPTDAGPGVEIHARFDAPAHPELTGNVEARGVWDGKQAEVEHILWETTGAHAEGAGAIASADDWNVAIREAHATEAALDALLALLEQPRTRFEADPGAHVEIQDLDADSVAGEVRVARGSMEFAGLTVVPLVTGPGRDGIAQAASGLRGKIDAADGVITLSEVHSNDLDVAGTLAIDRERDTVRFDLHANADLAHMPWTVLKETGDVERVRGRIALTRFAGTYVRDAGVPEDLVVEAELQDASLRYINESITVDITKLRSKLSTNGTVVTTTLNAFDAEGKPIALSGKYDEKSRIWKGELQADLNTTVPSIFEQSKYLKDLRALAYSVGASTFDVKLQLPSADRDQLIVELARHDDGQSALNSRFEYDGDTALFRSTARFPVERALEEYLPAFHGTGPVHANFVYDGKQKKFNIDVDAGECAIESKTILRKPAGTAFQVSVNGTTGKKWSVSTAELRVKGTPAVHTTGPLRNNMLPFEATLEPLAALLPEGATAGGTVKGSMHLDGSEGSVSFNDAAIALSPQVALNRIHGDVRFTSDTFACEGLEIDGARSDTTLTLTRQKGIWKGSATGTKLDVEALTELIDAAQSLQWKPERATADAPARSIWTHPLVGEFNVDVGELYYRRGKLDAVKFRVLGEERAIRVPEFSARSGEGTLLGSMVILPADTTDALVKSAVKWSALDGRVLNDMAFPHDQGFFGVYDGELTFDAPLGDYKTMLAAGNGSATWKGREGSLGNIGFASKLLTVLRTTEVINLKVPSLKDQGLTFKKWSAGVHMTNGVMTLKDVQLDGGAYAIDAKGTVDFASEKTNVQTFTRVLQSVGKVVGSVPIIGGIATALSTDLFGVPVDFSGSPYDLKVGMVGATGKSIATAPLRAGQGAAKAIGDAFKKLIPGGSNKEEEPEPPQ